MSIPTIKYILAYLIVCNCLIYLYSGTYLCLQNLYTFFSECTQILNGIEIHHAPSTTYQPDCSTECKCESGGRASCSTIQCKYDGKLCTAHGDPHYTTFDGNLHHYQGTCQYVHVERCTNNGEFSIKTRNTAHNSRVSCITQVTVEDPETTIVLTIGNPLRVTVNGVPKSNNNGVLYQSNGRGIEIKRLGRYVHVFLSAIGIRVSYDGEHFVQVKPAKRLLNQLCGLCGFYNNIKDDDLRKRNTEPQLVTEISDQLVKEFGDSWEVPNSCTNSGKRNVPNMLGCSQDPNVIQEGRERCAVLMGEVFAVCNSFVNATQFIESCEFDYRCCNIEDRENCYCDNLASYAAACADAGVTLSIWRNFFCRKLAVITVDIYVYLLS